MRKIRFCAVLLSMLLLFLYSPSFGQINIGDVNDSVVASFSFCLIIPEREGNIVKLQCADADGTMIYMEIRADIFPGKTTIVITPDEGQGPIREEKTVNWFLLPEKEDSIEIEIINF